MIKQRKERLNEAYEYIRQHFGIHTQSDLAAKLKMTRPALSSAMNGNEAYLTDNLFVKICAAYPGVFNLDYLQNGEGELLANSKSKQPNENKSATSPAALDMSFLFEKAIDKIIASNDKTIASMEAQVAKLEETIKTKDKLIHILELRIRDLEFTINTMKLDADKNSYHGFMSSFASEPKTTKNDDL